MRIKVITPLGTFVSVEQHLTNDQRHALNEALTTKLKDLTNFNCETENGPTYFGPDVIRNSVFVLLD